MSTFCLILCKHFTSFLLSTKLMTQLFAAKVLFRICYKSLLLKTINEKWSSSDCCTSQQPKANFIPMSNDSFLDTAHVCFFYPSLSVKTIPTSGSAADSAVFTGQVMFRMRITLKMKCSFLCFGNVELNREREVESFYYYCSTTLKSALFKSYMNCYTLCKNFLFNVKLLYRWR